MSWIVFHCCISSFFNYKIIMIFQPDLVRITMVVVMRMEPVMSMPEVWHAHAHRVILVTDIDVWDPATKITEVVTSWLCAKKGYLMTLKYYFYAFISFIDASMKWRNLTKTLPMWRKTPKNPSINQSKAK